MSAAMPFRWLWYLLRVAFCSAYAVVAFFSKPGARFILVGALAVASWAFFPWVQGGLNQTSIVLVGDARPSTLLLGLMLVVSILWLSSAVYSMRSALPLLFILLLAWGLCFYGDSRTWLLAESAKSGHAMLHAVLVSALLLQLLLLLWALAKVLALVLGTFPPPAWPLRPRAVLKAKNRVIAPAPVALAVPRLRASATRPPHDLHAALPPEVAALLTSRLPPSLP